jgi:hypothetical protein
MSNDKEFGFTNSGTDGIVPIQVEKKEPTILAEEAHKEQEQVLQKQESSVSVIPVEKKKRGRPAKKAVQAVAVVEEPVSEEAPARTWYCSTCKETIEDKFVMKLAAGPERWAVFCPTCQRSFGFLDQAVLDKVADLIKNNPTGK